MLQPWTCRPWSIIILFCFGCRLVFLRWRSVVTYDVCKHATCVSETIHCVYFITSLYSSFRRSQILCRQLLSYSFIYLFVVAEQQHPTAAYSPHFSNLKSHYCSIHGRSNLCVCKWHEHDIQVQSWELKSQNILFGNQNTNLVARGTFVESRLIIVYISAVTIKINF